MAKQITIYESFDGERFDSLEEAESHEECLKQAAIRSLCNHYYEEWDDYIESTSI